MLELDQAQAELVNQTRPATETETVSIVQALGRFLAESVTARVDNPATVNDSDVISNGVPATNAFVSYINEADAQITLNFDQADLIVNEPLIALTKTFESNINDAGDVITVTVTATNNGTANAYNLRVFDPTWAELSSQEIAPKLAIRRAST